MLLVIQLAFISRKYMNLNYELCSNARFFLFRQQGHSYLRILSSFFSTTSFITQLVSSGVIPNACQFSMSKSSQHTPRAAIRTSTAGSQRSGHFSSLINPCAFQVRYLQQEWWYRPSSAYSVTLSKQQRAKNVFPLENVRYGKNDTMLFFFLNTL